MVLVNEDVIVRKVMVEEHALFCPASRKDLWQEVDQAPDSRISGRYNEQGSRTDFQVVTAVLTLLVAVCVV